MSTPTAEHARSRSFGAVSCARLAIAASVEKVYAALLERSSWMEGFVDKVLIDGPVNSTGERARYESRSGARIEEVLVATPPSRLVARLADVDDCETHAFAEWRLEREADGSIIEFNLYWLDRAPISSSWPQIQSLRSEYHASTQRALENHLMRIKAAAEAGDENNGRT